MKNVITKFGGSSLADAGQIKKAVDIVLSSEDRRYIVVSAFGKRNAEDEKMTDLFIDYYNTKDDIEKKEAIKNIIIDRYDEAVKELSIDYDVKSELEEIFSLSAKMNTVDYTASRGEYLSAKIISSYLKAEFLDMQKIIIFNDNKKLDYELTYKNIKEAIESIEERKGKIRIVMPGFYGSFRDGKIVTFSRGGSDITGSLIARALNSDIYENWTDVSGVMFVDPRIAKEAKPIEYITYSELRELSYMGASVLHEETVYPVSKVGIPIHIMNTNNPKDAGTMIVSSIPSIAKRKAVTGIAGKKGFSSILLQKALMNEEIGYLAKLLNIFDKEGISVEHCPTGIDTISIVLRSEFLDGKKEKIIEEIKNVLNPDILSIEEGISLIAVVGEGMSHHKELLMKIFEILAKENIQVKMIDQGSSGINVIIGISDNDFEKGLKALSLLQYEE